MLVRQVLGPSAASKPIARLLSSTVIVRDEFNQNRPRQHFDDGKPDNRSYGRNQYGNNPYGNNSYSRNQNQFTPRGPSRSWAGADRMDQKEFKMMQANKLRSRPFGRFRRFNPTPPSLLTLADLTPAQISGALNQALAIKYTVTQIHHSLLIDILDKQTIALLFSKRSTRTRVASETAAALLKGRTMFLGKEDSQLGVNETLQDTAKVVGSMVEGFMARVNGHEDIEELAKYSPVPVINALSDLYHPTQILADLMTIVEHYTGPLQIEESAQVHVSAVRGHLNWGFNPLACLKGKKMAWVGDTNNISNELLVTVPRLGMEFAIASPEGYNKVDPRVWQRVEEAGTQDKVTLTTDPAVALKDADIVVTDTWISMGQEEEKAARLAAFSGYQITNEMVNSAGAKPDWIFMHCLPRKQEEVDDEVFYGDRSLVFQEAENRKWTTAACFSEIIGHWQMWDRPPRVSVQKSSPDADPEQE